MSLASKRVARHNAKAIEEGARRLGPLLLRDPAAIAALDHLVAEQGSQRAALEYALRHAAQEVVDRYLDNG